MDLDLQKLKPWIEQCLRDNTHRLAAGYQGSALLYEDRNNRIVIKTPHGSGIIKYLNRYLLRHEHDVYRRLEGHPNIPACYGLVDGTYLALEYIPAPSIREKPQDENSEFHEKFLRAIELMHQRGVAHIDLKRKGNLLIRDDASPVMIDFGTAIVYRPGYHPLNHYLFRLGKRFDYNSWIKHKYQNRMASISPADSRYYDRSIIEKLASVVKTAYRKLKKTVFPDRK